MITITKKSINIHVWYWKNELIYKKYDVCIFTKHPLGNRIVKECMSCLFNLMYVCMYVCMPFYVIHYHNNLMKAHHYHKSHQISSASLEKMNSPSCKLSYINFIFGGKIFDAESKGRCNS